MRGRVRWLGSVWRYMGGVADASAEKEYADALAQRHPRSPWKRNRDLMAQLVLNPSPARKGDIDLFEVDRIPWALEFDQRPSNSLTSSNSS